MMKKIGEMQEEIVIDFQEDPNNSILHPECECSRDNAERICLEMESHFHREKMLTAVYGGVKIDENALLRPRRVMSLEDLGVGRLARK